MCFEVIAQSQVNLFITDAFEFEASFQTLHFESTEFILQCLICTEFDGFQFHFCYFPFGFGGYTFCTGQSRVEIADAVQMYLSAFRKFLAHEVRKGVEYGSDVGF